MKGRPRDGTGGQSSREKRLADALKANLGRRKRQGRERAASGAAGPDDAEADRGGPPTAGNTDTEESS